MWLSTILSASQEYIFISLTIILLTLFIYCNVYKTWSYFYDRNLQFIRGWPIVGVQHQMFSRNKIPFAEIIKLWYNKYPNERIIGLYEIGGTPLYMVRDPELIKLILAKEFDSFLNHRLAFDEKTDPLLGRALFFMKDSKWRNMRTTLSPAFTGSKMRTMFTAMNNVNRQFIDYLLETDGSQILEVKDLFTRYSTDIIASCAFGLEMNSIKNKENDFYRMGKKVSNFSGIQAIRLFIAIIFPNFSRIFGIRFIAEKEASYFRNLLLENIKYRLDHNIVRPDMINLLIQSRNGGIDEPATTVADLETFIAAVDESHELKASNTIGI